MKKMILFAIVIMVAAATVVNAQSQKTQSKKDGVYNFTKTTASQEYFDKAKLSRLTDKKTGSSFQLGNLDCDLVSAGITVDQNPYGKLSVGITGSNGWRVGDHVGTSLVAAIGSSVVDAHLSGISEYDLSLINNELHGYYATRSLRCKTLDISLANQWEAGQLMLSKNCGISLFAGLFAKVSVEYGQETYQKVSYTEGIPAVDYNGGYSCFILSCGEQLGLRVKLSKLTLSVSENFASGFWRDFDSTMGSSQIGPIDVGQRDVRHPLSTTVAITYKMK